MNVAEKVAYEYLTKELHITPNKIIFSSKAPIDFRTTSGLKFEVKNLIWKRALTFSERQYETLEKENPQIIVVKEGKVIDVFPFSTLKSKGYQPYIRDSQNTSGMKTVRISDEAHSKLVAYAAHLTLERKGQVNLSEAVDHLLEDASAKFYKEKGLKEK